MRRTAILAASILTASLAVLAPTTAGAATASQLRGAFADPTVSTG